LLRRRKTKKRIKYNIENKKNTKEEIKNDLSYTTPTTKRATDTKKLVAKA